MLNTHEALAIGGTLLAGVWMLRVSLWAKAITWRAAPRCPSCGRQRRGKHCRCWDR